jgi:hypothetical protein
MSGTLHVGETAPASTPIPSPSEALPPADVQVTIAGGTFTPDQVSFAGGRRFSLELVNDDPGIAHGISLLDATGANVLSGLPAFTGPGSRRYRIDAFPAGTYTIVDPAHPEIRATLTIGGG